MAEKRRIGAGRASAGRGGDDARLQRPGGTVAGMTWVTAGAMSANALSYVLYLLAGRLLLPAGYGMFASLVTAQLVLAVPALALQAVIARGIARTPAGAGGAAAGAERAGDGARSLTYRTGAIVAVLAAVATPLLASVLDTPVAAAAAAMAMAPMLVLLAGEQGVLQGRERFAALGAVLGAAGVGKVLPAAAVLLAGGGATAALAASTVGTAVAVLAARGVVRTVVVRTAATGNGVAGNGVAGKAAVGDAVAGRAGAGRAPAAGAPTAVLRASQVQLVLIALTSVDLIMARVVLSGTDAGVYAMGSVATKAAFWLPAAVGVVLYPRMARPEHSLRAVRSTLAMLTGLGVGVVACAAAAAPLVPVLVGGQYRPVVGLLWLFALVGAAFAVLQGALLSTIARDATRLAAIAWAGLVVEGGVLALCTSVPQMVVTAAVCALGTTAAVTVAVLLSLRPGRGAGPRPEVSTSGTARWAGRPSRHRPSRRRSGPPRAGRRAGRS